MSTKQTAIDALAVTEREAYECGWNSGQSRGPSKCHFTARLKSAWKDGYNDGKAGRLDNPKYPRMAME